MTSHELLIGLVGVLLGWLLACLAVIVAQEYHQRQR